MPVIQDKAKLSRDVFIEWNPPRRKSKLPQELQGIEREKAEQAFNAATRTVVTQDGWKLCLSDKDKNQLFNLNKDPLETTNMFDSTAHQPVVSRLTKKIEQWQERVDDDAVVL